MAPRKKKCSSILPSGVKKTMDLPEVHEETPLTIFDRIYCLPPELRLMILKAMDLDCIKSMRLTCKRLNEVGKTVLKFIPRLCNSNINYVASSEFKIEEMIITDLSRYQNEPFTKLLPPANFKPGEFVNTLSFLNPEISSSVLEWILRQCTSVTRICVTYNGCNRQRTRGEGEKKKEGVHFLNSKLMPIVHLCSNLECFEIFWDPPPDQGSLDVVSTLSPLNQCHKLKNIGIYTTNMCTVTRRFLSLSSQARTKICIFLRDGSGEKGLDTLLESIRQLCGKKHYESAVLSFEEMERVHNFFPKIIAENQIIIRPRQVYVEALCELKQTAARLVGDDEIEACRRSIYKFVHCHF